ncbi:MAG: carbonic anhydrase [Chloroflexota bacterium]
MSDKGIDRVEHGSEWRHSRRRFLELGATALGSTLLSGSVLITATRAASDPAPSAAGHGNTGSTSPAAAAQSAGTHGADALLLNCMDYRLANEVTFFMNEHAMTNKYDQIVLAGATLGVATDKFPAWAETFWKHLDLAVELHKVKRVIAIDHRDCGAFKLALGQDFGANPTTETDIHTKTMRDFRKLVKEKHPNLEVEMFLMHLDGHVQVIA